MGYTGSVCYNGNTVFSEWKADGSFYCMDYPTTFMRIKSCQIDIKSIGNARQIFHELCGCGPIAYEMRGVLSIISRLETLLGSNIDMFDEKGNFIGVIKIQNADVFGNSRDINFYKIDRVSDVASADLGERMIIKEDDMADIKRKRLLFINSIDIFSSFDRIDDNMRSRYRDAVASITGIKSQSDVSRIIENMHQAYMELNDLYLENYRFEKEFTSILDNLSDRVADGSPVYVSYSDDQLHIIDGDKTSNIKGEFSAFSGLFLNNGVDICQGEVKITDRQTLREFIDSFPLNKKRNLSFENIFNDIWHDTENGKAFTLSVSGGF